MSIVSNPKRPDALWRGRTFEKYVYLDRQGSHWEVDLPDKDIKRVMTLSGAWSHLLCMKQRSRKLRHVA
jgi:hypothetical protein